MGINVTGLILTLSNIAVMSILVTWVVGLAMLLCLVAVYCAGYLYFEKYQGLQMPNVNILGVIIVISFPIFVCSLVWQVAITDWSVVRY